MKIIGLTGGTGSGKSTVSKIAEELGAKVVDADIIAREIVRKGQKALQEIVAFFGTDILLETGELNRKKLGSIVFADQEKLKILNQITHKYIIDKIVKILEMERASNAYNVIIIDAAILIQSGLYKLCDAVWVVTADEAIRLKRIMERDSLSRKDAQNRIDAQMPEEEMKKYATVVIDNTKGLDSLRRQVVGLIGMSKHRVRF